MVYHDFVQELINEQIESNTRVICLCNEKWRKNNFYIKNNAIFFEGDFRLEDILCIIKVFSV